MKKRPELMMLPIAYSFENVRYTSEADGDAKDLR
jgi:hypothetical protein